MTVAVTVADGCTVVTVAVAVAVAVGCMVVTVAVTVADGCTVVTVAVTVADGCMVVTVAVTVADGCTVVTVAVAVAADQGAAAGLRTAEVIPPRQGRWCHAVQGVPQSVCGLVPNRGNELRFHCASRSVSLLCNRDMASASTSTRRPQ